MGKANWLDLFILTKMQMVCLSWYSATDYWGKTMAMQWYFKEKTRIWKAKGKKTIIDEEMAKTKGKNLHFIEQVGPPVPAMECLYTWIWKE